MAAKRLPVLVAALLAPALAGAPAARADEAVAAHTLGPAARTALATRLEHGEGVARDVSGAVRLYCSAARAGHAPAQYQLGWLYANARGVPRDEALAAAWFARAAQAGDAHAVRMLARLPEPAPGEPRCLLPDGTAVAPPLRSVPDPSPALVREWVRRLAPRYGLDAALVVAVIRAESNFDPRARSAKDARGLMQLLPGTARRFGVADAWDPLENVRGGMAYLRWLIDHFDGDLPLALAGYNAGEGAVRRHGGVPPYAETRAYVERVTRVYGARTMRAAPRG